MQRIGAKDIQRMQGALLGGGWTPPAGCVLWLAAANSGAVAPLGTWADASGEGNDATLVADAYVDAANGLTMGQGASADYATSSATDLCITGALTVCAWVRVTTYSSSNAGFVARYVGGGDQRSYGLIHDTQGGTRKLIWNVSSNGTAGGVISAISNAAIGLSTWAHVAGVYVPSTSLTAYVNTSAGTPNVTGVPAKSHAGTAPLWVGMQFSVSPVAGLIGDADDIMVFPRALSIAEIQDIYANSPGSHAP